MTDIIEQLTKEPDEQPAIANVSPQKAKLINLVSNFNQPDLPGSLQGTPKSEPKPEAQTEVKAPQEPIKAVEEPSKDPTSP
ncbi:MAG: hypothetical protein HC875_19120, partial [Anaerolineales bacterium]|nr:hypothetical protein [Anaerolineales bacterium]